MKALFFLIQSVWAYDVSFITVNNQPVVEIVRGDKVCHYIVTDEITKENENLIVKKAFAACRHIK